MSLRYLDIHTHKPNKDALLCLEPDAFLSDRPEVSQAVSVGLHPWHVGVQSVAQLYNLAAFLQDPQVWALGECGLDKVCGTDIELQKKLFLSQLRMAATVSKPVIIHCVKAQDELLFCLSQLEQFPPFAVIHGFRGKPQQAKQLLAHGCLLSFGPKFNVETVKSVPASSFLLETDDAEVSIEQVYADVADARGMSVEDLVGLQHQMWSSIFGRF